MWLERCKWVRVVYGHMLPVLCKFEAGFGTSGVTPFTLDPLSSLPFHATGARGGSHSAPRAGLCASGPAAALTPGPPRSPLPLTCLTGDGGGPHSAPRAGLCASGPAAAPARAHRGAAGQRGAQGAYAAPAQPWRLHHHHHHHHHHGWVFLRRYTCQQGRGGYRGGAEAGWLSRSPWLPCSPRAGAGPRAGARGADAPAGAAHGPGGSGGAQVRGGGVPGSVARGRCSLGVADGRGCGSHGVTDRCGCGRDGKGGICCA